MFKIGDKVRCINDIRDQYRYSPDPQGIYTISAIYTYSSLKGWLTLKELGFSFPPEHFRLQDCFVREIVKVRLP